MACGVFPVCGDLESIREWIGHGENGLLVDPNNPEALANALLLALKDRALRSKAAEINAKIVAERADYTMSMKRVEQFYEEVIKDY
jgi:glycosyltransferase involved in cell wall biosynthesis